MHIRIRTQHLRIRVLVGIPVLTRNCLNQLLNISTVDINCKNLRLPSNYLERKKMHFLNDFVMLGKFIEKD